jgi:translocation and assembly module TamB
LSEPETIPEAVEEVLRRSIVPKIIVALCAVVLIGLLGVLAVTRYGVLLPQARLMIEARTDGLKIGRFGRLKIEGLSGDIWRDFTIRTLTIRDEHGVWAEADDVHMTWRYEDLFRRRFHADAIEARSLRFLRRPTLSAKGKDNGLPVSFEIDALKTRVEMLPAFSRERGLFDLDLKLDVERSGGQKGGVHAASVLHPGDRLDLDFDISKLGPLLLRLDAQEALGGALAGTLGLSPNRPFSLKASADGRLSAGRFTAAILSGDQRPLSAQGGWTKDGGQANGRLTLAASTLTAPWAARLGPEVTFAIAGRKATKDFFALDARANAANLSLRATGQGDLGTRTLAAGGLAVTSATPNLKRLAGGPQAGPARIQGRLTTQADGWRFAGAMNASRLAIGGYSLAEIAGPLELSQTKGALTVKAQAAGRGGSGAGLAATMLGASPKASFEGSRLADGRLALKALDLTGYGLRLQASGGRSLTGGLTFKGQADLTRLDTVRAGAAGTAQMTWQASQAAAGRPWLLEAKANGAKFATGLPELDRLLGPSPKLAAKGSVEDKRIALASASLDGAELDASGAGVLAADGGVTFKVDWTANGPFRAGPVEIAGKAKGDGAITGTLSAPRLDLMADLDAIDVPRLPLKTAHITLSFLRREDGSSGMVALTAQSAYGPAKARGDFAFPQGGVDLTNLAVDAGGLKAAGSLALRRGAPSAADLRVELTRGAFLDAGEVQGTVKISDAGGARASLNLTARDAKLTGSEIVMRTGRLTADGSLSRLPYTLDAQGLAGRGPWQLQGRGVVAETGGTYQATYEGAGRLGSRRVQTTEPAILTFGKDQRSARLRLAAADGGRLDVDARLTGNEASIGARATGLGLDMLDQDLDGKVDATLALNGQGDRLGGTLDAKLVGARGKGSPANTGIDGTVKGQLTDREMVIDAQAGNASGLTATANLRLPTEASASPLRLMIARQRPMEGRFTANGEVKPLWELLVGGERSLSGKVQTAGTLSGTLADPHISGQLSMQGGRFDDGATGLSLRQVALTTTFAQTGIDVTSAQAVDAAGGSVGGSGRISLERNGVSSFRLDLKHFRLIDNDQARAAASGQATIARGADGQVKLSGSLTIDDANIAPDLPIPSGVVPMDVIEKNRPADLAPLAPTVARSGAGWALDVTLKGPRRIFLRGRGLDVELSLDAHVGGTTARPELSGTAKVVRGDYDFAGKRFEFDEESVVYLSTRPEQIRLNLSATRDDPSLNAVVKIQGTAARPEITLTSSPVLPNDEVLSQVLFGRSASQLSPLEAAQLASAISALAGGGGFDVVGNLRTFAGLDRLAFGGGDASGVTVAGGKYLTNDVYLELIGGGREGGVATVEWRVRRSLSLISRLAGQGGARLAVRWRKDY